MSVSHGLKTVGKITKLPENWRWSDTDKETSFAAGESVTATACYIGEDAGNYEKESQTITITADTHCGGTATCNKKATCEVCKEEYGELNKTNHSGETEVKDDLAATCMEDGYSGDIYCKGCGEKLETGYLKTATGHQWQPATCNQKSICKICGEEYGSINPSNHTGGTVVRNAKAATLTQNGYSGDTYCKGCGALLQKGQIRQPSQAEAAKQISGIKNDGDVPGTVFAKLSARMVKVSKTSIKLKWNRVSGASGYFIYGNKCGAKNRFVKIATLQGGARTTYTHSKLKKGTYYKYIITAYRTVNGTKAVISTSKTMHIVILGGKYANPSSVKTAKTKVTLKKGGSFNLKAKASLPKGKKVQNHKKLSYESSNKTIATVSSKGIVKGKKKGSCYIYAYAQNGIYKKVKVTVK